ncbi:telomerase reverse transcriptase isoform X2 [Nicotiana tomentosiformis]|uniref:telomerase reverse transcriptase isoform X2 n=1 Tax=Nicotiana tomentosiformis TaxID=4098 RepID=UPI00388CA921
MSTKRRRVPPVLWRLFHNRARTLGHTILSLVPSKTSANCLCKGRQCLGCVGENGATLFLIREKDPDDYRTLLNKCFVVLSDSTPPLRVYDPHCRWSHLEMSRFSDIVELLTSPAWSLLLKRIGDVLMVYLLKNTSIFFRLPRNKHRQVAGVPICDLRRKSLLHVSATTYKPSLLHPESRKKRSVDEVYSSMRKKMCIRKNCAAEKLSTETTKCSDVLPSREGQFYSITHTSLCGKRKRQYKWQRQRKRKQLKAQEKYSLIPCMNSNTKDNWPGDQNCDVSSNSMLLLEKKNTWCSCCLVFQTIPGVKKEVQINRQTIFYKLESFPSVFPSKHIMNSLKPDSSGANRLFKEIFGSLGVNVTTQIASCTHSSNCTFIRSTCLYHSIIKLLKTLIRKAHHCQHVRLLEKHCSTPSLDQCTESIIATILERHETEASILAKGCAESGLAHNDIESESCSTTPESQPSLLEPTKCYCMKKQVVSFIWAVCRSIVPINLLGTPSNWRVLTKNISKLVKLRRFEKFTLKQSMRKIKLSRYHLLSDQYSLLKHKVLEHWIFWFFSSIVVPLVQANFYVTEAEHEKQDIFYYRKPMWENIISKFATFLRDQGYQELNVASVKKIIWNRSFGFSKVRLCPKGKGVRMLANLKASAKLPVNPPLQSKGLRKVGVGRNVKCYNYKSVNEVLKDLHLVLKHIVVNEPESLGSSVFDYNDAYKRLLPFLSLLQSGFSVKPGVFIIVSDVEKAFDSVDQDKLLSVLDDLNLEEEYFLSKVVQVVCTKKSLRIPQNWTLVSKENAPDSANARSCLPTGSLHGILVKQQVQGRKVRKEQLQSDLKEHIKRNVLRLGSNFFLQSVGIPQGSVLSSMLCSLYLGHLEKSVIFPFLDKACEPAPGFPSEGCFLDDTASRCAHLEMCKPSYLLLRFIDDLLFISTSKEQASRFFSRLQRGFRAYNCDMNKKKFGMNFQINTIPDLRSDRLYVVEDGTSFLRWSGLFINCSTLEIQADYTRYLNFPLSSTLTVGWLNKPGRDLKVKLCGYLRPKCHPIFYDSNINSAAVVRLNIYQAFLLCAMKFHCYISDLSSICRFSTKFYADALGKSLRYMKKLIKRRMFSFKTGLDCRPILELGKGEIEWLGLTAYIRVLKRKQSRYKELLRVLDSKLMALGKQESTLSVLQEATDDKCSSILWKIKY